MLLVKRLGKRVANAVALMLSVYLFVCLCVWPGENARIAIGWLKKTWRRLEGEGTELT